MRRTPLIYQCIREITYNGQPITWRLIEHNLTKDGPFRIRGASENENPTISGKMGVSSRFPKITSYYDVFLHVTEQPKFLSCTHNKKIALKFMYQNFENRAKEKSNVLHIIDTTIMPSENKRYVPDLLNDYYHEEETVLISFPEENYIAAARPGVLFGYSLTPNPWYVDPIILNANAELAQFFHEKIRAPYEEMAQDLEKNGVSEARLTAYKAAKHQFHTEYNQWCPSFFEKRGDRSKHQHTPHAQGCRQ